MTDEEIDALVGALAPVIKRHVDVAVGALDQRLVAVETRQPMDGAPGEAGKDGRDAPSLDEIKGLVTEAVSVLPPPAAGRDGRDADPDAIAALAIEKALAKVAEITIPKDGAAGVDGKDGQPGRDGKDADVEAITADVMEQVTEALKAIPAPRDGRDGADGADGVGLAGALIDRAGELVVTMTDGTQKSLGPVVGKDGAAGKDGADALGFDDLSVEFDGERTFKFVMVRGEARKDFGPYRVPMMIDRGVFKEGGEYQRGDACTWGGSMWVAQKDTSDKPETSDAWRLAVKRGRDGRDGVMKAAPVAQPVKVG